MQKWANEREKHWIVQYGGPLRDHTKQLKQTLNLTHGGQGNVAFASIDALRTVAWVKFKEEMNEYVAVHNTSMVPLSHISLSGYKLGGRMSYVRAGTMWKGHIYEAARVLWLESLPEWSWNVLDTAWEKFQLEMNEYVSLNGSSLVQLEYVSPSGYNLGRTAGHVRNGSLWKEKDDETERVSWLQSLPGWTWNILDLAWETFQQEMAAYVAENKTSLVPKDFVSSSGYTLGSRLYGVRYNGNMWKGKDDETERVSWLQSLAGWTWNVPRTGWETFQREMLAFVALNKSSRVLKNYVAPSGYKLGKCLGGVRHRGSFWTGKPDEDERVAWLELLPKWQWKPRKPGAGRPVFASKELIPSPSTDVEPPTEPMAKKTPSERGLASYEVLTPAQLTAREARRQETVQTRHEEQMSRMTDIEKAKFKRKTEGIKRRNDRKRRQLEALRKVPGYEKAKNSDIAKARAAGDLPSID
tara:strand:+ start:1 stop:1407 length:1407 start_codon:yes stop_codon:yes gene_type:complete